MAATPEALTGRYARLALLGAAPVALLLAWLGLGAWRDSQEAALVALGEDAARRGAALEQFVGAAGDHVLSMRMLVESRLAEGAPPMPAGPLAEEALAAAVGEGVEGLLAAPAGEGWRWRGALVGRAPAIRARGAADAELNAAIALFPLQAAAQQARPYFRWSYYFSAARDLVAIHPWAEASTFMGPPEGRDAVLASYFEYHLFTQILPERNPGREARWSMVYPDAGGTGLMVSLTAPVWAQGAFRGMVGTDLLVSELSAFLTATPPLAGAIGVEDQEGQSVADTVLTRAGDRPLPLAERLGVRLPPRGEVPRETEAGGFVRSGDRHVLALPVRGTPWRLVVAVPDSAIRERALAAALPYLALLAALALSVLLSHVILRRGFVLPAMRLVALIQARAEDRPAPAAALPALWQPWADRVNRAFDEQRAALDRISEAEAVTSGVVATALDAVVITDRDCRITGFNPAAERMFGHRMEEAIGELVAKVCVPHRMRAAHEAGLARYHATGVPHVLGQRLELPAMRADGSEFPVEISIHKMEAAGRLWFTAYLRDLTELRTAEAEATRQRERAHQAEKMSALGSLLAGVAHELNNPLSVVVAQSTMLRETAAEPKLAQRAERIHAAAQRCGRIVKTFLAMVRQQPPERREVDLNAVAAAALELAAYGLRSAGVEVETRLAPDLPRISADGDQLQQVVANLLVNAQQAMADRPEPRRLVIETRRDGAGVLLAVEDNGPGVPEELRERIFEPYFTTKPLGAGTGVGLAVCRNIVTGHGGTLTLEAGAMGGARMAVRLPRGEAAAAEPAADQRAAGAGRALVVDDEPEVAAALAEMLERDGYDVAVAGTVAEAEGLLRRGGLDLVFCDLRMPGGGGLAVHRAAAAAAPRLGRRFIFVTGDTVAGPQTLREHGLSGEVGVIEKPFMPEDVARAVAALPVV